MLLYIALALASTAGGMARGDEVTMTVRADRARIYIGEAFTLYVEVSGADEGLPTPDVTGIANAETHFLGSQGNSRQSIQIINGRVSREVFRGRIFAFTVKPRVDGPFRAGPVTLSVGGRTLVAGGPTVVVTGVQRQTDVLVEVRASSETVMVDEPFSVRLSIDIISLPRGLERYEPILPQDVPHVQADFLELAPIQGLKTPDMQALLQGLVAPQRGMPGFAINDYKAQDAGLGGFMGLGLGAFEPKPITFRIAPARRARDGRNYWSYVLTLDYTPQQEGDYTFGPVTFKGSIIAGADAEGNAIPRAVFAVGPAATVRVLPPPETGRPDWFVGSVGRDMRAQAQFDTAICKVGDPLTLTLDVTGPISLTNLRPPLLNLQPGMTEDFRIYDDNIASENVPGGKRFRYRVRPLRQGTLEFPPIKLAYFDTQQRTYVTVQTDPIPVQARPTTQIVSDTPGQEGSAAGDAAASQSLSTRGERVPDGIFATPAGSRVAALGLSAQVAWRTLCFPPAACLGGWALRGAWRRRQRIADRLRRNTAHGKLRTALRHASRIAATQPVAAAGTAAQALRTYLAERTGDTGTALTAREVGPLLARQGVDAAAAAACHAAFAELEQIPYRPDAADPAAVTTCLARLAATLPAITAALAAHKPKAHRRTTSLGLLPLLIGLLACVPAGAASADEASDAFVWEQANAAMAGAKSSADYLAAANVYNRLVRGGVRNGPLFHNLGTALLLAGEPAAAEAALVRAERYQGSTAEIRNNLRQAIALRTGQPDAQLPWTRIACFWHFGLSSRARAGLCGAGWILLWLGVLLRLASVRRQGIGRALAALLLGCGLALTVVFGTSYGTTLLQEYHDSRTWSERVLALPTVLPREATP